MHAFIHSFIHLFQPDWLEAVIEPFRPDWRRVRSRRLGIPSSFGQSKLLWFTGIRYLNGRPRGTRHVWHSARCRYSRSVKQGLYYFFWKKIPPIDVVTVVLLLPWYRRCSYSFSYFCKIVTIMLSPQLNLLLLSLLLLRSLLWLSLLLPSLLSNFSLDGCSIWSVIKYCELATLNDN